jgi:Ribbon-helix-helix protein, copG family
MSENETNIGSDELDWENAQVHEGRQPGVVVSVRLGPAEAARLRGLADASGLTVSQVIRQALAEFEPKGAQHTERRLFVAAFTYGGAMSAQQQRWRLVGPQPGQTQLPTEEDRERSVDPPTATEPTRVSERVTVPA